MSKKHRDGGAATMEPPAVLKKTYRFTFKPSRWLPLNLTLEGCRDEDDARAKLHEMVDRLILQVEQAR